MNLPDPKQLLAALEEPAALLREARVFDANEALRALFEGEPLDGRPAEELVPPPGLVRRERAIDDAWTLCTFPRSRGLDEWLDQIPDEAVAALLLAHRQDPISIIDAESGRFLDVSDAWCRQYGWTREEAIAGMGPADVSAEPEATDDAVRSRAGGDTSAGSALRWHRRRDGSVFPVELQCGVLEVRGKRLVYARLRDIEERVRAEEALRRSEARFRELIEQLPHAVVVHRDGDLLYLNPTARALLGFGPDEDVTGVRASELVHPDDRERVRVRVEDLVYRGEPAPLAEERLVRRDGTELSVEVIAWPVHFDGAPAALAVAQDVTAKKRLETQLLMADRLASLGRLAASVGHEINNPLAYVLGSLEVLRGSLEDVDEELRGGLLCSVDAAEHGARRVRDIVRDLRSLSRGDDGSEGPAELGRTLDACVQMASHELKHRARVERDYPPNVWVAGSEGRLGQIFLNLLVNAAQAIDEGALSDNEVRVAAWVEGSEAIVEVADTGRGLPAQDGDRIFEPFFTTKRGTGTGLGLSICHHITNSLGGRIEAEPRTPRGTVFRVRLPLAPAPAHRGAGSPVAPVARFAPDQRALVVEDEAPIRELLVSWLADFDVAVARSGREAIERVEAEGPFDLIVCDLMMGDLTGMDVHARLAESRPGQERRMIFTTGGAFTPRARAFLAELPGPWLEKPFGRNELRALVRRTLPELERHEPADRAPHSH